MLTMRGLVLSLNTLLTDITVLDLSPRCTLYPIMRQPSSSGPPSIFPGIGIQPDDCDESDISNLHAERRGTLYYAIPFLLELVPRAVLCAGSSCSTCSAPWRVRGCLFGTVGSPANLSILKIFFLAITAAMAAHKSAFRPSRLGHRPSTAPKNRG